jgi:negative regulator of sigma E activity
MTEQINDQISAFIDDELSAEESALLVRRFERDPNARQLAMRYTMIGAALRGELLDPHPSLLQRRVSAVLSGAAPPPAVRPVVHWSAGSFVRCSAWASPRRSPCWRSARSGS